MLTLEAANTFQPALTLGRVLVVEDEDVIRDTIALALQEEGYEVLVAEDGRSAMEIVCRPDGEDGGQLAVDLVILDLMLPGMDGFEVLKQIRKKSDVPVLMLSSVPPEEATAPPSRPASNASMPTAAAWCCSPTAMAGVARSCRAVLTGRWRP